MRQTDAPQRLYAASPLTRRANVGHSERHGRRGQRAAAGDGGSLRRGGAGREHQAVRVHCQSGPSMSLGTGSMGHSDATAVMATSVTTAAQAAIRPGLEIGVMVCAPHQRAQANIGHPRPAFASRSQALAAGRSAANTPAQPAGNPWTTHAIPRQGRLRKHLLREGRTGRTMSKHDAGYDYTRYQKLLAEAVDERKRLELIDLMIRKKARDRLATSGCPIAWR